MAATVRDATGNRISSAVKIDGDGTGWFNGLCRQEPAWKLQVEFGPKGAGRTRPAWEWTAREIEVPPVGKTLMRKEHIIRPDATLRATDITGEPPVQDPTGSRPTQRQVYFHLREEVPRGKAADRARQAVFLRGADERGRPVALEKARTYYDTRVGDTGEKSRIRNYLHILRLPMDAKRLNLTFGVYETRIVEFLAKP